MSSESGTSRGSAVKDGQLLLKASVLALVSFLIYRLTRTRHFGGDDTVFVATESAHAQKNLIARIERAARL